LHKAVDPDTLNIKSFVGRNRYDNLILDVFALSKIDHHAYLERVPCGICIIANCAHGILLNPGSQGSGNGMVLIVGTPGSPCSPPNMLLSPWTLNPLQVAPCQSHAALSIIADMRII
jgi:hypothetical protein